MDMSLMPVDAAVVLLLLLLPMMMLIGRVREVPGQCAQAPQSPPSASGTGGQAAQPQLACWGEGVGLGCVGEHWTGPG